MAVVTGNDLILSMREDSDNENDNSIEDQTWLRWVNDAISETYGILVEAFQQYNVTPVDFTLTTSPDYDLSDANPEMASGFFKEVGVNWYPIGRTLDPVALDPLDTFTGRDRARGRRFFISGQTLTIYPRRDFQGDYTLLYTPDPPVLAGPDEKIPREMVRWRELIVVNGAIRAKIKKEQVTTELEARLSTLRKRVEVEASQRQHKAGKIPMPRNERDRLPWYGWGSGGDRGF
jgi:hypothetical protein